MCRWLAYQGESIYLDELVYELSILWCIKARCKKSRNKGERRRLWIGLVY